MTSNNSLHNLAYDETFDCVQCGYCLPACPTYMTMKKETHSPRGRINLVQMVAEGKLELEDIREPMELCLGCRACETVCPTNVQYGTILNSTMYALTNARKKENSLLEQKTRKLFFKHMLTNKNTLSLINTSLRFYQNTVLEKTARTLKLTHLLPNALQQLEKVTPKVHKPKKRNRKINNSSKKTVGFFTGCVMDTFFSNINDLSIQLLELAGFHVVTIQEQQCCGALQHHAGEKDLSIELAKHNIEAFEKYNFDYIVNAIGGCGATLIEYPKFFSVKDPWHARAVTFSEKTVDISVLLDKASLPFKKRINKVITYQPSCHLTNVQKVVEPPLRLIKKVPGITYRPMPQQNMCCGSGGIYNITHYEESMKVLDHKMKQVNTVTPDIIVTTNPGCHLQMAIGVNRENKPIEVVHLVELLARSCDITLNND